MKDSYTSALLMYSIIHSEKGSTHSKLTNIVSVADYADHAIMTYSEFKAGLKTLQNIGFIYLTNNQIRITDSFKIWWVSKFANKKRSYVHKEIEEIGNYISESSAFRTDSSDTIPFSESDFENAVNEYLARFKKIK